MTTYRIILVLTQIAAGGLLAATAVWLLRHDAPVWVYALIAGWGFLIAFTMAYRENKRYEEAHHRDE